MPPEMPGMPGAPPAPSAAPKPPGAPGGPGATPMLSPGAGLGAQASAINKIKDLRQGVIDSISLFPQGSPEQQALLRVAQTLSMFTKQTESPVPKPIQAMNAPGAGPPGGAPGIPGGPPMPGGPEPPMMGAPA